ncbi:reverse transcriptase domain-containing protein [Tanacetum coccineum]
MRSHIGSYDGKGDPDNYLHLFEGAIRMQKWVMPVACHMFTYTLKDSARIWWNSQKAGSILNYEDLKAKFRSHFSQQKKFTKTHLAVHNIMQREGESTRAFATRYTDDTLQILGLPEDQRKVSKGPRKPLGKTTKDREAGIDHGHDTNQCRELKHQIEEAVKLGQLAHLVKGIKKKKEKMSDTHLGEWKKGEKGATPIKAQVLMISRKGRSLKKRPAEEDHSNVGEITFPPLLKTSSADPVVIKAYIYGRQVNRIPPSRFEDSPRRFLGGSLLAFRRSASRNYNWRRTAMQQMGIVVSTIYGAIKFHIPRGIGTILSEYNPYRTDEGQEETNKTSKEGTKDILSCVDAEERIIVNNQYPE